MKKRVILIGIQARSSSTRLPNKIHLQIGGRPILQHIIDSCVNTVRYLKNDCIKYDAEIKIALLVPKGDPAASIYKNQVPLLEGDEKDVLSRYVKAAEENNADFIVRVTGDCLFLPTHLISKHIKSALIKNRDYTTNIIHRTFKEGLDCEVISRRALNWLNEHAKTEHDREHVTTRLYGKNEFPFRDGEGKANICHIINYFYEADIKTSIDTAEDFENAKRLFSKFQLAKTNALRSGIFIS